MTGLLADSLLGDWGVQVSLFLLAFVKFFIAAVVAMPNPDLTFWDILIFVGGGAIISVVFYTYFGKAIDGWIRKTFRRNKSISFAKKRRRYLFWKKYGVVGTAFMAPFISPMASVGIAVSFRESPRRIIFFTSLSILFWTLIFAGFRVGVLQVINWAKDLI